MFEQTFSISLMEINHGFTTKKQTKNMITIVKPWSPHINNGFATLTIIYPSYL